MAQFRTIEIDFDVHKVIENQRRGFDETPNDVLRRLLSLGERQPRPQSGSFIPISSRRNWSDKGVVLRHGTAIRMSYSGHTYEGQIVDGEWVIGDQKFDSPSGAASGVAITKKGKTTRLDGWLYWHVKPPSEETWTLLDDLRPKDIVTAITLKELGL